MFAGAFTQDVAGWETGSSLNFQEMFYAASSFNVDLSSWEVSSATDFSYREGQEERLVMFQGVSRTKEMLLWSHFHVQST